MMNHYRMEIRRVYFPGMGRRSGARGEIPPECPLPNCKYRAGLKANRLEHLSVHIGLTHRKLMDFLPPEEWPRVFGSMKKRGGHGGAGGAGSVTRDDANEEDVMEQSAADGSDRGDVTKSQGAVKDSGTTTPDLIALEPPSSSSSGSLPLLVSPAEEVLPADGPPVSSPARATAASVETAFQVHKLPCPVEGCDRTFATVDFMKTHMMIKHFQSAIRQAVEARKEWGVGPNTLDCPVCSWAGPRHGLLVSWKYEELPIIQISSEPHFRCSWSTWLASTACLRRYSLRSWPGS